MYLARTGALLVTLVLSAITAERAHAQFAASAHLVQLNDAFQGSLGIGARLGVDPPILPISVFAVGEYFFPDCGPAGNCSLRGASVEVNFELPIPLVGPYASLGWAWREINGTGTGDESRTETGPTAGVGAVLGLGSLAPFFEARYEFIDAPEQQFELRLGALFKR